MITSIPATILHLAALCVAWYAVAGSFIDETEPKKPRKK